MRRFVSWALLLAVWFLLWGQVSVGNLLTGLVAVTAVTWYAGLPAPAHRLHPWSLLVLGGYFAKALVESSVAVSIAVLRPTEARLATGIVTYELRNASPLVATVVADAISLTPGTLTLDVLWDPPRLDVHVMGLGDPDEVLADIRELEDKVLAAIEPVGVARTDAESAS